MGLFGSGKIRRQKNLVLGLSPRVFEETDRVYANQVMLSCGESASAEPAPMGIYKSRLFTSSFLIWPFRLQWWTSKQSEVVELISAVTGRASLRSTAPASKPVVEIDETTRERGFDYFVSCLVAIDLEMAHGPSRAAVTETPEGEDLERVAELLDLSDESVEEVREGPKEASLTEGFHDLTKRWIDALDESTGPHDDATRKEFNHMYEGAVWANLRLLSDVAAAE